MLPLVAGHASIPAVTSSYRLDNPEFKDAANNIVTAIFVSDL